jgi:hypothetical protein
MKKAAIISSITLFSVLLLASCPDFSLKYTLEEGFFYAQNMKTRSFYEVKAEMLFEGKKCVIWAEVDSGVPKSMAKDIADKYDNKIRSLIVDTFGEKYFSYRLNSNGVVYDFDDILIFANWLTGRDDGKLTILLLDIQDGYVEGTDGAYTAGYFYPGNFLSKGKIDNNNYSNGRDMIYVDTKPGLKEKPEETYATFAHELQHLVNFVTTVLIGRVDSENYLIPTDVWVNEGLSAYAEYLYLGKNPADRCGWLHDNRNTVSTTGNNFFVWGNHSTNPFAIMDDYATVYLFFRWLYLQAGAVTGLQSRIFFDIGNSRYPDYRAVTESAKEINSSWEDWETLLRTWLAANYYPKNPYGYTGDEELQKVVKVDPVAGKNILLYPGEGVYSIINNNSFTPAESNDSNPHIRYTGLTGNTITVDISSPYGGDALLTFNANTDNSKGRETGSLTGVSSPAASPTADDSRSAAKRTGPYIIDAWDMWGRDQNKYKLPLPQ